MPPSIERTSPVNRTALTPSVEGYVSAIYALAQDDEPVGTQAIASELGIAAPSVTEMLRRLDMHGLVEYRRGSGARLTRSGILVARRQERRRAVIATFITTTIGLPAEEAAEEARITRASSQRSAWSRASASSWARHPARGAGVSARFPSPDSRRGGRARGQHVAWDGQQPAGAPPPGDGGYHPPLLQRGWARSGQRDAAGLARHDLADHPADRRRRC